MFSRILLASDGSDDANHAADMAASLAERFGAHLHALHVFPLLPPASAEAGAASKTASFEDKSNTAKDVVKHWAKESETVVEHRIGQILKKHRLPYTFHQENGDPAAIIVEIAARQGFDLIVLGCRGLGPALSNRLGSVSDWVSHNAPCPVLIVRPVHKSLSEEERSV
jgi:nucleotide-binding universal stress UspA family protein